MFVRRVDGSPVDRQGRRPPFRLCSQISTTNIMKLDILYTDEQRLKPFKMCTLTLRSIKNKINIFTRGSVLLRQDGCFGFMNFMCTFALKDW